MFNFSGSLFESLYFPLGLIIGPCKHSSPGLFIALFITLAAREMRDMSQGRPTVDGGPEIRSRGLELC